MSRVAYFVVAGACLLTSACDSVVAPAPLAPEEEPSRWYCHWTGDYEEPEEPPRTTGTIGGIAIESWECHWNEPNDPDPGSSDNPGGGGTSSGDEEISLPTLYDHGVIADTLPNCNAANKPPEIEIWCDEAKSDVPSPHYSRIINAAVDSITQDCPELDAAWGRVRQGVRLWAWDGEDFGGGSTFLGSWVLFAYQWLDVDPRLAVAHELLHIYGYSHPEEDPSETEQFRAKERECSGGRNA